MSLSSSFVNLADPQWELVDPTPNVHALFVQFDAKFFWGKLPSVVVRWSKRMYSCAGICRYQGRGGLCDIALSEPLLKLRPRKDLVETLLHEMIHAYLFLSDGDRDRDGHGPNFCSHMNRINKIANLSISIYHSFHDEVKLYQTHWWRCNGPCQNRQPYFGMVRRTCNRAPGPNDTWWSRHQQTCAGSFIKVKEPEKKNKPKSENKKQDITTDITKFIKKSTTNIKTLSDLSNTSTKDIISDPKKSPAQTKAVTPKQKLVNTWATPIKIVDDTNFTKNDNVLENVRNHWANKSIPTLTGSRKRKEFSTPENNNNSIVVIKKRKFSPTNSSYVDDEETASILKDIYGENFTIFNAFDDPQPSTSSPIPKPTSGGKTDRTRTGVTNLISTRIDVPKRHSTGSSEKTSNEMVNVESGIESQLVDCPLCMKKVKHITINEHLDNCLGTKITETETAKEVIDLTSLDTRPDVDTYVNCPVCNQKVTENMEDHIDACLDKQSNSVTKDCPVCNKKVTGSLEDHMEKCSDCHSNRVTEDCPVCNEKVTGSLNDHMETCFDSHSNTVNKDCPVCNEKVTGSLEDHMETCLSFFKSPESIPDEGHNSSLLSADDIHDLTTNSFYENDEPGGDLDESSLFNETGSKCPCPCCLKMIEQELMNSHLDICLASS